MPKVTGLVFLLVAVLCLCSCSQSKEKPAAPVETLEPQVVSQEVEVRSPIYIHQEAIPQDQTEIFLKLGSDPLLLASGYARLAGVVSGRMPLALLEVGGRGRWLEPGDLVNGYRLIEVSSGSVRLIKEE
jgi:hypothetical protein